MAKQTNRGLYFIIFIWILIPAFERMTCMTDRGLQSTSDPQRSILSQKLGESSLFQVLGVFHVMKVRMYQKVDLDNVGPVH